MKLIKAIADYHIRYVDKYYRMFAGLSSNLDDYKNETVFLTINITPIWIKTDDVTIKQIVGDWICFNKELADAKNYHVIIKRRKYSEGFIIKPSEINNDALISQKIADLKASGDTEKNIVYDEVVYEGNVADCTMH